MLQWEEGSEINNKATRCYDKKRTMTNRSSIWITKHKKATIDNGIPIRMEISKLVRTRKFKNMAKECK